ncbi:MAG: hemolysin, partial [Planctomycetaceae bacterium]|nr:hemolysin [Planctomycetaceae bacterium]
DGSLAVDDLFGRMALPDPGGSRDYSTVSGLVLDELEKIPSVGDAFRWNGLLIEVVDMDGRRIDRLLVQRVSSDGK